MKHMEYVIGTIKYEPRIIRSVGDVAFSFTIKLSYFVFIPGCQMDLF